MQSLCSLCTCTRKVVARVLHLDLCCSHGSCKIPLHSVVVCILCSLGQFFVKLEFLTVQPSQIPWAIEISSTHIWFVSYRSLVLIYPVLWRYAKIVRLHTAFSCRVQSRKLACVCQLCFLNAIHGAKRERIPVTLCAFITSTCKKQAKQQ